MKFLSNLNGRVRNFNLPKNEPLIPLFEAISNSIQAIDEAKKINGEIIIQVLRYGQLGIKHDENKNYGGIDGFIIQDNGIGLDENNFKSFMEADSTYKYERGGKGIGRFTWLKAFDEVDVESCYKKESLFLKRKFKFSLFNNDIPEDVLSTDEKNTYTKIILNSYKQEYRTSLPTKTNDLVESIIEYFFAQFISENFPKITIIDILSEDETLTIDVKKYFEDNILKNTESIKFNISCKEFELIHIKTKISQKIKTNKLYLSAHERVVEKQDLKKIIVDMNSIYFTNNDFGYIAILKGKYLDDNVRSNRLEFSIPTNEPTLDNSITKIQILESTTLLIEQYLDKYLKVVKEEKINRINNYIQKLAPQYKHLYKYAKDDIIKIKPNLSDEKLDDELNNIKRKVDKEAKKEFNKFYHDLNSKKINNDEYQEQLKKNMEKITDLSSSSLAEYVGHRKVILEVLEKTLYKKENQKYHLEEEIHNIIYPMRTDSDTQSYENHNLWIIDEKLSYSKYISSDIPFNNSNKQSRPDILLLDNPNAVADNKNEGEIFENITLFELKRPMRDDYKRKEDTPYEQMLTYIDKLKTNNIKDRNGRVIRVDDNTRYFLYAICDITPSLESIIRKDDFEQTIDKLGYYKYFKNYKSYVEIISYDKLIKDAKKRNRIFFDKLGIL